MPVRKFRTLYQATRQVATDKINPQAVAATNSSGASRLTVTSSGRCKARYAAPNWKTANAAVTTITWRSRPIARLGSCFISDIGGDYSTRARGIALLAVHDFD